jgi:hypothetical protein
VNDDSSGEPRALLGFAISAKRYALYERDGDDVRIIDQRRMDSDTSICRKMHMGVDYPTGTWSEAHTARMAASACDDAGAAQYTVLQRLNRRTRPHNFPFCPLIDVAVGYPQGVDRARFTLIAPFTKDRDAWLTLSCIDVADGKEYEMSMAHDIRRSKVIPQTYGYVLHLYPYREESKSLAPDGSPCVARTRGVLQRASVSAAQQHFVGKETDRRWEFGDDLSILRSKSMEYRPRTTVADAKLREQVDAAGVRALMRATKLSQHTLEAIRAGRRVRSATIQRVVAALSVI